MQLFWRDARTGPRRRRILHEPKSHRGSLAETAVAQILSSIPYEMSRAEIREERRKTLLSALLRLYARFYEFGMISSPVFSSSSVKRSSAIGYL